jgi:pimeloyl-ACP methyl ester carboxylesterase
MAEVRTFGDSGPAIVYLHGAGGLFPEEPMLDALGASHRVFAPVWPGYGEETADELRLKDMLDFALYGWDVVDSLELDEKPALIGHSMGGMIAAEMAAIARHDLRSLVLIDAAGLWDDAEPIPDIFAMLPFELAEVLFADPAAGEKILTAGMDFSDDAALTTFMIQRARRLGMAGKLLFPVPSRHVERRLHRVTVPTLVLWGDDDRLIPPSYAERWAELIPGASVQTVAHAGHMLPYEQSEAAAAAIDGFIASSSLTQN